MNLARLADQEREGGPLFDISPRDWLTLPLTIVLLVLGMVYIALSAAVGWLRRRWGITEGEC